MTEAGNGTDEALDVEFAALTLGLTERMVYHYVEQGKLIPLVHFEKTIRFSRNALNAWTLA